MNNVDLRQRRKNAFRAYFNKRKSVKLRLDMEYKKLEDLNSAMLSMSDHSNYNVEQFANLIKEKDIIFGKIKVLENFMKRQPSLIIAFFKIFKTK